MKDIGISTLLAVVMFGMPLLPVLAQSSDDHPMMQSQDDDQMMQGDRQNMMGARIAEYQKQPDTLSVTLADMTTIIAAVRQTKDVSALHKALDELRASVTKMEVQILVSHGMMQQMMRMQGDGGMMNPVVPDAPR
jgi:hypothetical protein